MKVASTAYIILFLLLSFITSNAQIVINEFVPANVSGIVNGRTDDWIEIYNNGNMPVDLQGYGLTDDVTKPFAFRFPTYNLLPGDYILVYPTGETNSYPADHWETAISSGTSWRYFAGTTQPDTNWRNITFNDGSWPTGNGGIGFGDGDDNTTISTSAKSVMMRKTFNIADTSKICKAIFNIDYDDGFAAFLNGSEIARANLGTIGNRPVYNDLASVSHEAVMYSGGKPDSFYIDPVYLKSILRQGVNTLSVEVHNQTSTSNDLSSKPFLTFGMTTSGTTFPNSTPPSWFGNPSHESYTANFKLSRTGETLYLFDPQSNVIDQKTYIDMQPDHSFGRIPDGAASWCLIKTPTPETSNNSCTCYIGYCNQPVFSLVSGFYTSSQYVALTNTTPGGVIRYTTNGNTPTTTSAVYSSPIHLTSSKTIKAKVFATGYLPSQIITNTYVIGDNIDLPVFSISTDSNNLWNWNTGIYVMGPHAQSNSPYFGANFWQDWTKPATIEYFDKLKSKIFTFDADINIYGNYSRSKPQKSMEIRLRDSYGIGELNYVFIPDKSYIDKINNIVLRNSGTDWNEVHFRDAFMERVLKETHSGYIGTEPVVMYLNGAYWGVFTIHENHDQHWIKNNWHYKEDEIDYLIEGGSSITAKRGTDNFFYDAYNYATTQSPSSTNYYNDMSNFWDLDNYKDYFIAETYYNNGDWIGDWTNNIKMWRPTEPGGKLRYLVYDLDMGLGGSGSVSDSTLSKAINPSAFCLSSNMFDAMLHNSKFKREFINRYADLINTIFKPAYMLPIMHQFQDSMSHDMVKHFAKWGSNMSNWQSNINGMVSFINNRPSKVRNQVQNQFNLVKQVTLTFNASPAGAGRIQVSTIVPGPLPWSGVYFDGNPVTITAIPNPGYTFDHWNSNHSISNDHNQTTTYNFHYTTESITAYFTGSAQTPMITVSEFNYNSNNTIDAHDWIELHNYSSIPIDLSLWKLKDQDDNSSFSFPVGTVIAPNGYLVAASDLTAFGQAYPAVNNVTGPLGFDLNNSGDQIRLIDPNGQVYLSFYFQDITPWPLQADGLGFTCELLSDTSVLGDGNSWFPGCIGGSPGKAYTPVLSTPTHVSGNPTFCTGTHTVLSVNYTPGYTYQWQRNHIDIPTATDTTFTTTIGGDYTVRVINQGCSSISDTLSVSVVTTGTPPTASSISRCGEGSVTFTAAAPDSVYWFDAPNGNILGTGLTFATSTLTASTTFYAQSNLSCPSTPVAVDAIINPVTASPVCSNVSRCGPGAVVLNAVDTAVVHWFNSAVSGAQIFSGNIFITGFIPHDTTYYIEAGDLCPSERIPVTVSVSSAAMPIVNNAARCGSGALVLTASSFAPVYWFDSLIGGSQVGSGVNFLTPVLNTTTNFYAEANNGCASARAVAEAMINPIPAPPIGYDSIRCGPGSVNLSASSNVQVVWYGSASGGNALSTGSNFTTPSLTSNTVYYAESFDVCSSTRVPVTAIVEPLPASPAGNDVIICGQGAALLTASASNPIYWFGQPTGGQVLGTGSTFTTPVISATTSYYAIAVSNCSSVPVPVTAIVVSIPSQILGNDTTIQSGSSIILDAGSGYDSYHWSTGAATQTISVNNTGSYIVEVSQSGCTNSDTLNVNVILGVQDASTIIGSLNIYPNPASEKVTIDFLSKKSIKTEFLISDITGKELKKDSRFLTNGKNMIVIDMSDLAKGIYLLTIRSEEFNKTLSVVVE